MGKRNKRNGGFSQNRGRGGRGGGGGGSRGGGYRPYKPRSELRRENAAYQAYYDTLGIIPEEERQQFWDAMKTDLPNSFRFAGSRGHALTVQKRFVEHYIPQITSVEWEGKIVEAPTPVEWYPEKLAWQMSTPKNVIRKFPPFASFQKFLVSENGVGNITRQEVVSMVPPLMMDIRPGMTVLDMCAAPGSKTVQMIEMLHGGEEARVRKVQEKIAAQEGRELSPSGMEVDVEQAQAAAEEDYSDDGRATGLLVANDAEYRRANMLVHQCKRMNSPNIIVTNHDATLFPSIKLPSGTNNKYMKFDRILADVPCSGDGTTRKNTEIWKEWGVQKGIGLHLTQVRILVRALQMLKVGGQVVYSTCSLNPVENESVVAAAIDRCGGTSKVKLLDKSSAYPDLKRVPGLTTWRVMDKYQNWWDSWNDVKKNAEENGEDTSAKLVEGMFPPGPDEGIPLQHCMRIYPHLQDTGGFFIAVLEKQTEIRARPENEPKGTKNPAALKPEGTSIVDVVNEIEAQTAPDANGFQKLETLDNLEPSIGDVNDISSGNPQAVARQNDPPPTDRVLKRHLDGSNDDDDDGLNGASSKRVKIKDDPDPPASLVGADRQQHWPPPPGANLEATAHKASNGDTSAPATAAISSAPPPRPGKADPNQPHEEAFIYLPADHSTLLAIRDFYAISPRFPLDRFMVRNASGIPAKAIYYTSALCRDIITTNAGSGLKLVHCGVKMFVKQDVSTVPNVKYHDGCQWRIQSEGLPILEPWVGSQRVVRLADARVLRKLLREQFPRLSPAGSDANGDEDGFGAFGRAAAELSPGCAVLRVELADGDAADGEAANGPVEKIVLPVWRGTATVNLMLPKEDRKAMLLRLFNDESGVIDHSDKFRNKSEADKASERGAGSDRGRARPDARGPHDAELEEALSSMDEAEDGGVALDDDEEIAHRKLDEAIAEATMDGEPPPATEEDVRQVEDRMLGEAQNIRDQTRDVAPGVVDEDGAINRTV